MKKIGFGCGLLGLVALGCNSASDKVDPPPTATQSINMDMPPPATVAASTHASEGPHHGALIELGKEEYHAELVHDAQSVTIYLLDGAAKEPVQSDASEVIINLLHAGMPRQFKLAASPEVNDPAGTSSRFVSTDSELPGHLEDETAAPKLNVAIAGKAYRGIIVHGPSHAGHDHAH